MVSVISAHASGLETMSLAVKYHRWIYDIVRPYMGARVLEIGGGLGNFGHLCANSSLRVPESGGSAWWF